MGNKTRVGGYERTGSLVELGNKEKEKARKDYEIQYITTFVFCVRTNRNTTMQCVSRERYPISVRNSSMTIDIVVHNLTIISRNWKRSENGAYLGQLCHSSPVYR